METLVTLNEELLANTVKEVREYLIAQNDEKHNPKTCNMCRIGDILDNHINFRETLYEIAMHKYPEFQLMKLISIYLLVGIKYAQALKEVEELKNLESLVKKEPNG